MAFVFLFLSYFTFWIMVLSGYMPSSGITESYGGFIPSFLRELHIISHSVCINLYSHNSARVFPFLHILSSIYCL